MTGSTERTSAPRPLAIGLLIESDGPGGAETVVIELAKGLAGRGHRVVVVVPEREEGWLPDQLARAGIEHVEVSVKRPFDPAALLRLRRIIRDYGLDVVHAHEFTMAVYGAAATLGIDCRFVVTMHGGSYAERKRRRRRALRWAARRSAALLTVSSRTADRMRRSLGIAAEEIDVVRNGISVPCGSGDGVRDALGVSSDTALLLCAGSLYRVKGYDILLRSLAVLPETVRNSLFVVIAGRGKEGSRLEALARDLGVEQRVVFLGHRNDVPTLMKASDAFVLPSRSEGLPLALLEAMGAALPVVATSVGGIPEVVEHEIHGLVVPPDDPQSLAKAIARLVTDPTLRSQLGSRARSLVLEKFTTDTMISRYEEIYRGASRGRPSD